MSQTLRHVDPAKVEAYACLSRPLNFVGAVAEFLPICSGSFDWVHMRSMIDHVQVPDLTVIEARRVLRPDGKLLVGLYVEGGKHGKNPPMRVLKDSVKWILERIGITKWKDYHVFHPTFSNLCALIKDNGFEIEDVYWQPYFKDTVCYIKAAKSV